MNDPQSVYAFQHNELPLFGQPEDVVTLLNEIQQRNLSFMQLRESSGRHGGFIFDEMGLGKTLTILAYLTLNKRQSTLIVVPKNVLHSWEYELNKHVKRNTLTLKMYYGTNRNKQSYHHCNIILTTYETVRTEFDKNLDQFNADSFLHITEFDRIVLDEAHIIRTYDSLQTRAILHVMGNYRWALTGTPIVNRIDDLYTLFAFIKHYPHADHHYYKTMIVQPIEIHPRQTFQALTDVLVQLSIRHTKSNILQIAKHEYKNKLLMKPEDHEFYRALSETTKQQMTHLVSMYNQLRNQSQAADVQRRLRFYTIGLLTRLRQAATSIDIVCDHRTPQETLTWLRFFNCNICLSKDPSYNVLTPCGHKYCQECIVILKQKCLYCQRPYANTLKIQDIPDDKDLHIRVIRPPSAKTDFILDIITKTPTEKFIVYTVWLGYLDILQHWLRQAGISCLRIEGSVSAHKRLEIQNTFTTDASIRVLICSLTAAGVGLNLQISKNVILADIYWNDAMMSQASSRIERIGQTSNDINVHTLISQDTIDEAIQDMVEKKSEIALATLTGTNAKTNTMTWANHVNLIMDKL